MRRGAIQSLLVTKWQQESDGSHHRLARDKHANLLLARARHGPAGALCRLLRRPPPAISALGACPVSAGVSPLPDATRSADTTVDTPRQPAQKETGH